MPTEKLESQDRWMAPALLLYSKMSHTKKHKKLDAELISANMRAQHNGILAAVTDFISRMAIEVAKENARTPEAIKLQQVAMSLLVEVATKVRTLEVSAPKEKEIAVDGDGNGSAL